MRRIERTKIFTVIVDRSRRETKSKPFDWVSNDSRPEMKIPAAPRAGEPQSG